MKWILVILFGFTICFSQASEPQSPVHKGQRIVLITDATSGLGREIAFTLALQGDHVIVHDRVKQQGEALVKKLNDRVKGSSSFFPANLNSNDEIQSFSNTIVKNFHHIDVLITQVATAQISNSVHQTAHTRHFLHSLANYRSNAQLTDLLLPLLERSSSPQVINITSLLNPTKQSRKLILEKEKAIKELSNEYRSPQILVTNVILADELKPITSLTQGRDTVLQLINRIDSSTASTARSKKTFNREQSEPIDADYSWRTKEHQDNKEREKRRQLMVSVLHSRF